jgi:hypothetical protein
MDKQSLMQCGPIVKSIRKIFLTKYFKVVIIYELGSSINKFRTVDLLYI